MANDFPDVDLTLRDKALGLGVGTSSRLQAKIGTSSLGTAGDILVTRDQQAVKDAFGTGPLVEAALLALRTPGSGPVLLYKAPSSTPGEAGEVTHTGAGTGSVAVAGDALDAFDVVVEVLTTGANLAAATATFRYSLDGGRTWSGELAVPTGGTYLIPDTGLTLTFANGESGTSFVDGDTYTFSSSGPTYTVNELGTALDALDARPEDFFLVHIIGAAADAAGSASLASSVQTKLDAWFQNKRWARALIELPDVTATLLTAGLASTVADRVVAVGGYADITSGLSGAVQKRPFAWALAARAGAVPAGRDLARKRDGPLSGVTRLYHDERTNRVYNAARISSGRTFIREAGFYVTNAKLLSSDGSDFKYLQHGRILDVACGATYRTLANYLSDEVSVDPKTGLIDEDEARGIEGACEKAMRDALLDGGPQVTAVACVVDRSVDIIATEKLVAKVRVTPKGYPKVIEVEVAFNNPRLNTTTP
jgi:hypothetical protein